MIRKRDRYKFLLKCGDVEHVATPIYNGLKKVWEQESGEIFFREKLEGTLKFVGKDYAFVRGCDFAKQIDVEIYKTTDNTEELYWKGYFRKTDCETDINHGMISVKPKPNDKYKLIMDKLSEEYNLVKHNPKMSDVSMTVRPMLQVYELGADYVNNYIGNFYFKQNVEPIYSLYNYSYMQFATTSMCVAKPTVSNDDSMLDSLFFYIGDWEYLNDSTNTALIYATSDDGRYRLVVKSTQSISENNGNKAIRFILQTNTNGGWTVVGAYKDINSNSDITRHTQWITYEALQSITHVPIYTYNSGTGIITNNILAEFDLDFSTQCGRGFSTFNVGGHDISNEDNYIQTEIYTNVSPFSLDGKIIASKATSTEITEYGKVKGKDNEYYIPTNNIDEIGLYEPILQQSWSGNWSFWLKVKDVLDVWESNLPSQTKTLKDWYSLYEVIRVLLKAIDPNVTVSHGSASSMFLWSKNNPITGMENQGEMFLLQKSNATKLEYDYSATKAEIKLKQIFDWLKTFNVYWDVVEYPNGMLVLRIEHKLFYMNGESYNSSNITNIDLRNIHDTRNGKDYAYLTNNWKYEDVNNVATKIYYKWMDEVSLPFEGEAMTAVDNPYGEEHQETRTAEAFTSDIDYIFANSETVSKDGFVVVQGYKGEGERAYKIHFYDTTINGRQYHLQNGLLSVAYMQRYYMLYDMPSRQMTITGGDVIDVVRTKQLRQNEVKFALPKGMEINEYTTLTTETGVGTILRMEQDLSTEIYTTTLKYDNEQ